ncbi:MAG TPA: hypothetical protein VH589_01795 [Trebonia sp.]|jgi:hypothetical protein
MRIDDRNADARHGDRDRRGARRRHPSQAGDQQLLDGIAERLAEGAKTHGDEDFSATYLTSNASV